MVQCLLKAWYRIYQTIFYRISRLINKREPKLLRGIDASHDLPNIIGSEGVGRVLIITSKGLLRRGLLSGMLEFFDREKIFYTLFDGVTPEPEQAQAEAARDLYRQNGCKGIVAFGGGAAIDAAKATAALLVRPGKSLAKLAGVQRVDRDIPPLYAVPTTAGAGSEATVAAVISDTATKQKYAILDTHLLPRWAILDFSVTKTLSKEMIAGPGMDAITHAVEAYIGRADCPKADQRAKEAALLLFSNLESAYLDTAGPLPRQNMLLGAHYAGLAFSRAGVGYAHSLAHALGALYGAQHGILTAALLPHVLEAYGQAAEKSLSKLYDFVGLWEEKPTDHEKAAALIGEIRRLNAALGIPESFAFIRREDIPLIAEKAAREANPRYPVPRILFEKELAAIVEKLVCGE